MGGAEDEIQAGAGKKNFQSPWGEVNVARHVYQRSKGGKTLAPMELQARIIAKGSTPRFAKMVRWKYAQMPASQVAEDLEKNHGRKTSRELVQNLGAAVGKIALEKERVWVAEYACPCPQTSISAIDLLRGVRGEGKKSHFLSTRRPFEGV